MFCLNLDFLKKCLEVVKNTVNKKHENGFEIHFSVNCMQFKKNVYVFHVFLSMVFNKKSKEEL